MFLLFCQWRHEFNASMITAATREVCWACSGAARGPVPVCLPVLLDEELQCLSVGEHDVRIHAEVVVARRVLTAKIPDPKKTKRHRHGRESSDCIFQPWLQSEKYLEVITTTSWNLSAPKYKMSLLIAESDSRWLSLSLQWIIGL